MRKKLIIATAVGVLSLGGVAMAVPVLADTDQGSSSVVERFRSALSGLVEDGALTQEQADEVATTLDEAGLGRGGHHGGERLGLETAAETLGMTEAELRTALVPDGTSLADVAETEGVGVDTLVEALVQAQQERIAQAVEDGRLTQEEADERLADLQERVTERVNSDAPSVGHHGRGGSGD